eukprot:765821-Hanusia_phi.AAC.3
MAGELAGGGSGEHGSLSSSPHAVLQATRDHPANGGSTSGQVRKPLLPDVERLKQRCGLCERAGSAARSHQPGKTLWVRWRWLKRPQKYSPSQIISGEAQKLYRQNQQQKDVQRIVERFEKQRHLGITGLKDEHLEKLREAAMKFHSQGYKGRREIKQIENITINQMFQQLTKEFEEQIEEMGAKYKDGFGYHEIDWDSQEIRDQREEEFRLTEAANLARRKAKEKKVEQVGEKEEEEPRQVWIPTDLQHETDLVAVMRKQLGNSSNIRALRFQNKTAAETSARPFSADEAFRRLRQRQATSARPVVTSATGKGEKQDVGEGEESSGTQKCQLCCEEKIDDQSVSLCACGYKTCKHCTSKLEAGGILRCPACRNLYLLRVEETARIQDSQVQPRRRIGTASSDDLIAISNHLLASAPPFVQRPKVSNRSPQNAANVSTSKKISNPQLPINGSQPMDPSELQQKEKGTFNASVETSSSQRLNAEPRDKEGGDENNTVDKADGQKASKTKSAAEILLGFTATDGQETLGRDAMDEEVLKKRELLKLHLNTNPGFLFPEIKGMRLTTTG